LINPIKMTGLSIIIELFGSSGAAPAVFVEVLQRDQARLDDEWDN